MPRKFIDISIPIENDIKSDPPGIQPHIEYLGHQQTVAELAGFFPGLQAADLPDNEAWAYERINLITHNGTHLDAPYHFSTMMDKNKRAITIDEVPLEWCFQQGVKVTGIDGWSWDAPFVHTREKYLQTKDVSLIWEGHKASREISYCHLEKLHNLENIPSHNFLVCCFPVKIKDASAG